MVDFENKPSYDVCDLKRIVDILRSPGGCPWDFEQTHMSIRRNFIEEVYEAAEAIDTGDTALLLEELGDVLMQVVFHADIEEKAGNFTLGDVADAACKKLIRRHPHVFGDKRVTGSGEVLLNWDVIKRGEKNQTTAAETLQSVARSLPALWRAEKVQVKAAKSGFDWPEVSGALDALRAEVSELENAIAKDEGVMGELGDVIFSAVNVARFCGVDPEDALGLSTDKFISRFEKVESAAGDMGQALADMTLAEMDELYNRAKLEE